MNSKINKTLEFYKWHDGVQAANLSSFKYTLEWTAHLKLWSNPLSFTKDANKQKGM